MGGTFLTLLLSGAGLACAQDQPPDLHMLLNMDLFQSQSSAAPQAADSGSADTSMMDQIRALKALGYLKGGNSAAPASVPDDDIPPPPGYGPGVNP